MLESNTIELISNILAMVTALITLAGLWLKERRRNDVKKDEKESNHHAP